MEADDAFGNIVQVLIADALLVLGLLDPFTGCDRSCPFSFTGFTFTLFFYLRGWKLGTPFLLLSALPPLLFSWSLYAIFWNPKVIAKLKLSRSSNRMHLYKE
jgi:hypothetical protein